jgi:hypothetical protein
MRTRTNTKRTSGHQILVPLSVMKPTKTAPTVQEENANI